MNGLPMMKIILLIITKHRLTSETLEINFVFKELTETHGFVVFFFIGPI